MLGTKLRSSVRTTVILISEPSLQPHIFLTWVLSCSSGWHQICYVAKTGFDLLSFCHVVGLGLWVCVHHFVQGVFSLPHLFRTGCLYVVLPVLSSLCDKAGLELTDVFLSLPSSQQCAPPHLTSFFFKTHEAAGQWDGLADAWCLDGLNSILGTHMVEGKNWLLLAVLCVCVCMCICVYPHTH